jgi:hypothetical protein
VSSVKALLRRDDKTDEEATYRMAKGAGHGLSSYLWGAVT